MRRLLSSFARINFSLYRIGIVLKDAQNNNSTILNRLETQLNIKEPSDWYKITKQQIKRTEEGRRVLKQHNNSKISFLHSFYPNYNWKKQYYQFTFVAN